MKLVLVQWEDASVLDDGAWVERDSAPAPEPKVFTQVGFLVSANERELILTQAFDERTMAARERIPRGMVVRIVELDPNAGKPLRLPRKGAK